MIEQIISIPLSKLEKGTITETGTYENNNAHIRTESASNYAVQGNQAFVRGELDFEALKLLPVDGTFNGTTDLQYNIPNYYDTTYTYTTNVNYELQYYYILGYDEDDVLMYAGYLGIRRPIAIGNKSSEKIYINYRIWQQRYPGSMVRDSTKYCAEIDVDHDTITYYNSGTSGDTTTTTVKSFVAGSLLNTNQFEIDLKGERHSEVIRPDVALLGFIGINRGTPLLYSERWFTGSDEVVFSPEVPLNSFAVVLKIDGVENPTVDSIIKRDIKLQAEAWYLDENDKLDNIDIIESIEGDIFTPPYPATMWYLDERGRLQNALLPEPYVETHGIIHDDASGNEYFNQHNETYDNALKHYNNNYRLRLEILSDEETTIGEITKDLSLTATGQITINYEQITRRSCSLSLINIEKKYIPTKNSPFWLNRKFRLWLGLVVGKDTYWWSQGIFYTVSANATGRILNIEGVDKGGALDGTLKLNMTEAQYQFKRGKALTEMIKQTLALDVGNPYGSKNSPIGFGGNRPIDSKPPLIGIEYYGFKTVADISIDANSYISEMFTQMAELYAADCYYNTNGNLVFEPHIDSTGYKYVPTQWEFTDLSSMFEDVNYEYNFEGENVVTVYTNTTQAGVRNVAWTAYNTNPLSPLNVATGIRRAAHIEIPYYYNEELSQEQQEAQQIKDCRSTANHYLLANSMLGMTLNFNAPIIPHMDVNKTIDITDQYADIENGIYVVQSITIPLSSDKMQISATNINWLPNDMTFGGVSEIVEQNGGAGT